MNQGVNEYVSQGALSKPLFLVPTNMGVGVKQRDSYVKVLMQTHEEYRCELVSHQDQQLMEIDL